MEKSAKFSSEISTLRQGIEQWRRTRTNSRGRIPAPIWAAAAELARTYGVSMVSQELRLNHQRLKSRVGSKTKLPTATFVELKPAQVSAAAPVGIEIEMANSTGEKMTIRVSGNSTYDVAGVVSAFLGSSRK